MIKFLKILFVLMLTSIVSYSQISTKEVEKLLYKYNIKNPDLALRVGILESGRFKSRKAIQEYNIFGFETGKKVFTSYDEAVIAYRDRIESRMRENENGYKFLLRIKYAADKKYIQKLKKIKI